MKSHYSHLYKTAAWQRRRAAQLRQHPLCVMCLSMDNRITAASVADHITPHRGDPVLFRGPLQSLCASCHSRRKQQLETTGHVRGCDVNGRPLDPNHPWNRPTATGALQAFERLPAPDAATDSRSAIQRAPGASEERSGPMGGLGHVDGGSTADRPSPSVCTSVNRAEKGSGSS